MFFHNLKYTIKTLFRNKTLIFWTFAFPIILGTLFYVAFSNIENSEKLNLINIAIVENEDFTKDEIMQNAVKELSKESDENQIFSTTYTTEETAKQMLNEEKITGYLVVNENNKKVVVKQNGINETIFRYVVEEIEETKQVVTDTATKQIEAEILKGNFNVDYNKIYQDVVNMVNNEQTNIKDISNSNLSYTMIEFYTLIAMACLYGATLGVYAINKSLANMSTNGMRVAVSPIKKWKIVLSSSLASYITQLIGLALLFAYTIIFLNVDYGERILPIILLALVGSLAGLSLGIAVGTVFKSNENTKTSVVISFTMLGCFLSGMMGITMKYIVDKNAPIVNMINPANMITDGFYALYYYTGMERYWFNISSLLIFALIMIASSFVVLRRQKYDSI